MALFSNDLLSNIISPSYNLIDSINHLNQRESTLTTLIWDKSFAVKNNLVFKLIEFTLNLIILLIIQLINQFAIKTQIKLIGYKTYKNYDLVISKIMQGKYALIGGSEDLEKLVAFMNQRYSIPFHLSEQKAFLSFIALPMRKSLPKQITEKINKM